MCQNPATTPAKAQLRATTLAIPTGTELVIRRRNTSWRLTSTRVARSGMATEKATTQTLADRSREAAVRNGATI
jgi:hypothetical protein